MNDYVPTQSLEITQAHLRELAAGYKIGLSGKSIDECPYEDDYPMMISNRVVRAHECPGILRQWWKTGWRSGHEMFMKRENTNV